jgi:general secretion pathway protein D
MINPQTVPPPPGQAPATVPDAQPPTQAPPAAGTQPPPPPNAGLPAQGPFGPVTQAPSGPAAPGSSGSVAQPAVSGGAGVPSVVLKSTALRLQKDASVTVIVQVENMPELFSAPMRIAYNPAVLRLMDVNKGDFLGKDGQQVVFSETKVPDQGKAIVSINRVPGAGGMSGGGTLLTLRFQAIAAGESPIGFEELTLRDAKLQPIKVAVPTTTIAVQ